MDALIKIEPLQTPEVSRFVAALEALLRRIPGSGPYMLDIRDMVDARWGRGTFLSVLRGMER